MRLLFAHVVVLLLLTQLSAQTHQWAFDIPVQGTNSQSTITAQATDDSSNVYIGGTFRGKIYLGTDSFTFNNGSNFAIFLAKYDKDGNYLWGQAVTTAASANIIKILINSSNQVLLYGSYLAGSGSITFGTQTLSRSSGVFLTFMNPNGTFSSAKDLAYGSFTAADDIALGPNDEIHALMYLSGFGVGWNIVNGSSSVAGTGFVRVVAKYNSSATSLTWQNNYSALDMNGATSIDVDRTGQVFFLASIAPNKTVLGTFSPANNTSYLVWLRPNGSYYKKLVSTSPTASFSYIGNVAVLDSNTIYVAGHAYGDSMTFAKRTIYSLTADPLKNFNFVAEIKNFDTCTWSVSTSHQGFGQVQTYKLAVNGDFLYFSSPQNTPIFSFGGFTNSSFTNTIVSKLDRLGNVLWFLPIQSVNSVNVTPIGTQDMVYSGEYVNSLTLAPFTLPSSIGGGRSFLARTFDYSITRGEVSSGPYCAGDSIIIPYERSGTYGASNQFIAELSDEKGQFLGGQRELGRITFNEDSTIVGELPLFQVASSDKYRIRIKSTSPVVQSFFRLDTLNLLIYSTDDADPGPDTSVCFGDTIELSTFGGTTWSWSQDYNIIGANTRTPLVYPTVDTLYQIIIGDSSGCGAPDTAEIRVSIVPPPAFEAQRQSDTLQCINTIAQFNTTFGGGTGMYYVHWYLNGGFVKTTSTSNTADSLRINVVADTDVMAILTDSCSSLVDTAFFAIRTPQLMVVDSLPPDTFACVGDSIQFFASASHQFPERISYLWRNGLTTISSDSTLTYDVLTTRILRVSIINSCNLQTVNHTFTVDIPDPLEVSITSNQPMDTFCASDDIEVTVQAQRGGIPATVTPTWIINTDTTFSTSFIENAQTLLSSYPGQYDYELIATANDGCPAQPTDTVKYSFHVLQALQLDSLSSIDTLLCDGLRQPMLAYASFGNKNYDFVWQTATDTLSREAELILTNADFGKGKNSVKVLATDGCSAIDSLTFNVFVPDDLRVDLLKDSLLCNEQDAVQIATYSGGLQDEYTYSWRYNGAAVGSLDSFVVVGVEHDLFRDSLVGIAIDFSDGCMDAVSDSVTLRILPKVVSSLVEDSLTRDQRVDTTICRGQRLAFSQKSYYAKNKRTSWWLDGVELSHTSNFVFDASYQETKPTYKLQAVVYDSCSTSSDTATVNIVLREPLVLQPIADTTLCQGEDLILRAEASGGAESAYQYNWIDNSAGLVLSITDSLRITNASESSQIELVLNDGCTVLGDTLMVDIAVRAPLEVSLSQTGSCTNDPITLTATGTGGKTEDHNFMWTGDGVFIANGAEINVSPDEITIYQVILNDGCTEIADSSSTTLGPKPQFTINEISDDCEPLNVSWNASSINEDTYTYQLLALEDNSLQTLNANYAFDAGDYDYWVIATDELGCSDSIRSSFLVKPLPNPAFTWTPDEADFDNTILTFAATEEATTYRWQLEGGAGTQRQFTFELNEVGEYPVKLIVELDGCFDSLTQIVYFKDAFRYFDINSFSPNGDGLNDRYKPFVSGVISLNYEIYNRWGELVHRGSLEDTGWDGTYQGETAPVGNYLVMINWLDSSRKRVFTKSVVKLLR